MRKPFTTWHMDCHGTNGLFCQRSFWIEHVNVPLVKMAEMETEQHYMTCMSVRLWCTMDRTCPCLSVMNMHHYLYLSIKHPERKEHMNLTMNLTMF